MRTMGNKSSSGLSKLLKLLLGLASPSALLLIAMVAGFTIIGDKLLFAGVNQWFKGQASLGQVAYDLSVAYIGAYSFYLLVVYAPEQRRREQARPAVAIRVTTIVQQCRQMFHLINQESTNKHNISALSLEAITDMFSGLDLFTHSPKVKEVDAHGNWIWLTWTQFFNSFREETEKASEALSLLSTFYDAELLALVDKVNKCEFFRNITPPVTIGHGELRLLRSSAYDYYVKVKALCDYADSHGYIRHWSDDITPAHQMVTDQYPPPMDISSED